MSSNPQTLEPQDVISGDGIVIESNCEQSAISKPPRRAEHLQKYHFQPGQSGNPSGRPKRDIASDIALEAFARDPDALAEAFHKALRKANPKVFKELADRAFGKVPLNVNMDVTVNIGDRLEAARRRREQRMQLASNNVTEQSAEPGELGTGGGGGSTPESE